MIAGIDEAGKGCVIGPLVIAGVSCNMPEKLLEIGVKDSKKLKHSRRLELGREIREISKVSILKISALELNKLMVQKNLNQILKEGYAQVILKLQPKIVYVDCPDVVSDRFGKNLESMTGVSVVSEHKADEKFPIVAAASIIAKVERDKEIEELKRKYGDFGSGYASDPKTRSYLNRIIREGKIPPFVRKKWKTLSKLMQRRLSEFK